MVVLAVGCHPDDLEIGCGGTLARYVLQGHNVVMCHVANGDLGHAVLMPEELRATRIVEAENAGKIIGALEVVNIDVHDLVVDSKDPDTIEKMVALVRRVKPDVIITHNPTDYMRDHQEVSRLVYDASFCATVPHFHPQYPAHGVFPPIYYMDTLAGIDFQPQEYVDITDTIEIKLKALDCHESQIKWMVEHDKIDFLDFARTVSKFRGLQCNATYAEGFRKCEVWPRLTTKRLLP